MKSRYPIYGVAWFALVALRFGIGFHFFQEGVNKLQEPKPFTAGFFGNAKGPLAPRFESLIWDVDGRARLNQERTLEAWDQYRERVARHYQFDESQQKQAGRILGLYKERLNHLFAVHGEDIDTYFRGLERRAKNRADAARQEVPGLRAQSEKIETELKQTRGPWLAEIDRLWAGYERDLNELSKAAQRGRGTLAIEKPGRSRWSLDSVFLDSFIPYFDLVIGVCLMLGLATRPAASVGALFLVSVIATQPPWVAGAAPVYYQAVEALALFFLAAVGAGRYGGLDFLLHALRMRCCPPKKGVSQ